MSREGDPQVVELGVPNGGVPVNDSLAIVMVHIDVSDGACGDSRGAEGGGGGGVYCIRGVRRGGTPTQARLVSSL